MIAISERRIPHTSRVRPLYDHEITERTLVDAKSMFSTLMTGLKEVSVAGVKYTLAPSQVDHAMNLAGLEETKKPGSFSWEATRNGFVMQVDAPEHAEIFRVVRGKPSLYRRGIDGEIYPVEFNGSQTEQEAKMYREGNRLARTVIQILKDSTK